MIKQIEEGDTKGGGLLFQRISLRSLWGSKELGEINVDKCTKDN